MNRFGRIDFQNPTTMERVAIHEAAHAVWSLSPLLPPVQTVELEISSTYELLGGVCRSEQMSESQSQDDRAQERLRQKLAVLGAGAMGEELAFGNCWRECLSDAEGKLGDLPTMGIVLDLLTGDRETHSREASDRAASLLIENWDRVEHVAVALLKVARMPGELLRVLMSTAPKRGTVPPLLAARLAEARRGVLAGLEGI